MKRIKYNKWEYLLDDEGHLRYIGKSFKPNQPIGLTDYMFMFADRDDLNYLDLSHWDMSNAINLYGMFYGCTKLEGISYFNYNQTYNIKNMSHMFYNCYSLITINNLSEWITNNVIDTSYMFYNCKSISGVYSFQYWNLINLDNAEGMFLDCDNVNSVQLNDWVIPSTANIYIMATNIIGTKYSDRLHKCRDNESCKTILPLIITEDRLNKNRDILILFGRTKRYKGSLGKFTYDSTEYQIISNSRGDSIRYIGTSKTPKQPIGCIKFQETFSYRIEDEFDLSNWDMSKVYYTSFMFENCLNLNNISSFKDWNTKNITIMSGMFSRCKSLKDIDPLRTWNVQHVSSFFKMFSGCMSLVNILPLSYWDLSSNVDIECMFESTSIIDPSPLEDWDYNRFTSNHSNHIKDVFKNTDIELGYTKQNGRLRYIGYSNKPIQPKGLTDYSYMFEGRGFDSIDLSDWDMSEAINLSGMFYNCFNLKDIESLKNWNTSKVEDMNNMFNKCFALKDICGLKYWNTSKLISMNYMFEDCIKLEDIYSLKDWKLDSIESIDNIFNYCKLLTHFEPISNWMGRVDIDKVREVIQSYIEIGEQINIDHAINNDDFIKLSIPADVIRWFFTRGARTVDISKEEIDKLYNLYLEELKKDDIQNPNILHEKEKENMDKSYIQTLVDSGANLDGYRGYIPNPSKLSEDFDGDLEFDIEMEKDGTEIIKEGIISEDNKKLKGSIINEYVDSVVEHFTSDYESELLGHIKYNVAEYVISPSGYLTHLRNRGIKPIQPKGLTDYSYMFLGRDDLEIIDLSHWDMSEVINIEYMFCGCINLKYIIGLEKWDLSKVENYEGMFKDMDYNVQRYYSSKILNEEPSIRNVKQIKVDGNIIESLSVRKGGPLEADFNNIIVGGIIKSLLDNNINDFTLKGNDDKSITVTINQLKEK